MSKHRRACVTHQRQFFSEKLFHKSKDSVSNPDGIVNIFSNRLGISYQEAIHARDVQSVLEYGNKHMYRKRLTDFQLRQSNCLKVKEKQETRFLRACRRVFKTKEQNIPDLNRHRLRTAQRYRFLFLKSQYINKPVKHLIYNHGLVSEDYGFSTPHYYKTTNHADSRAGRPIIRGYNHLIPEISPFSDQPWVREYDPYPDMFIPYKYRDIIPKDPLYTDTGDYIRPGSRSWFTYMCNLHRRISSATTSQERKYLLQSEQERERETRELLQKEQAIKAEAQYYGTSVHTLSRRRHASKMLTGKTRHFHERMNYLTTTPLKGKDVIRHAELNAEMESFELYYNSGVNFNERSKQATRKIRKEKEKKKEITSDDTKELEHRPKKCNTALVANNFFHTDEDRHKRNRPSEVSVDTTAVAGPSRIKF
ncbi:unnamed protein product [Rhizophagus irregularis]|nr:unnamed protein product [Rhizophagus irregularis]